LRLAIREDFDVLYQVAVTCAGTARASVSAPGELGTARILDYEPEYVVIEARAEVPAMVVLADAFNPGWQAMVDGRVASIERANGLMRAVAIPSGVHRVEFRFRTPGLALGGALTAAAILSNCLRISAISAESRM
jgi:uncharacterized membrane protein YfhO